MKRLDGFTNIKINRKRGLKSEVSIKLSKYSNGLYCFNINRGVFKILDNTKTVKILYSVDKKMIAIQKDGEFKRTKAGFSRLVNIDVTNAIRKIVGDNTIKLYGEYIKEENVVLFKAEANKWTLAQWESRS